jgi:hypothetical protein
MNASDPLFSKNTNAALGPDQVHLTYINASTIVVSWATGEGLIVAGPPNTTYANSLAAASLVQFGTSAQALTMNATGFTTNYTQIYTTLANGLPNNNYSSPLFHHVPLTNLMPLTTYFYKAGDPQLGQTAVLNFTTPPAVGSYPFNMGVVADVGQTVNSSMTIQRLADSKPQAFLFVGDWVYADTWLSNGTVAYTHTATAETQIPAFSPSTGNRGTYQPRWDLPMRWLQKVLFAQVPGLINHGNHEIEPQYNTSYGCGLNGCGLANAQGIPNTQFQSYFSRFPVALAAQQSAAPAPGFYYSQNIGPAHVVSLSNYADFSQGSAQYKWLQQDLASFNRTLTPWLIAHWHAPWYSTYTSHYKEAECMRQSMEGLLYNAGVDVTFLGHLHAYERTNPVYNYTVNQCGTVHVTMGDGGNIEGLYKTFVDEPGACPANSTNATRVSIPTYQPGGYCPSFTYNQSNPSQGFCPNQGERPAWVAFRQPAFGHGNLNIINSTHALWTFNRNLDPATTIADQVYIIRDNTCANKQAPKAVGVPTASLAAPVLTAGAPPAGVAATGK